MKMTGCISNLIYSGADFSEVQLKRTIFLEFKFALVFLSVSLSSSPVLSSLSCDSIDA
jgi:hypothetical protein